MCRNLHILTVLLSMLLLFVSCVKEERGRVEAQRAVQIMVSSGIQTKAVEDPTPQETRINSIRVYAFINGVRAGYHHEVFEEDTPTRSFLMDMKVMTVSEFVDVEFFLVANDESMRLDEQQPALSESYTREDLLRLNFTAFDEHQGIPMYHNETVSLNMEAGKVINLPGHEDHILIDQKLAFSLERPIAKLAVYAAKFPGAKGDLNIRSVTIRKEGTRLTNYLFPQTADVLNQVGSRANDRLLTQEGASGVPAGSFTGSPDVLSDRETPSNYTHIATGYVSEVSVDRQMVLDIEYSMGEGSMLMKGSYAMPVIRRNNIYYVLCLVNSEGHIEINSYTVRDWDRATEEEEVGNLVFDYPTYSYLTYGFDPSTGEALPPPADMVCPVASAGNPFTAYFQMLYPQGAEWRYTTVNAGEGDVIVSVYECNAFGEPAAQETEMPVTVNYDEETMHGDTRWYQIKVSPTAATTLKTIKLGLTFDPGWISNHVEYLMINGVQGGIYWPGSGTDPNIIEIKVE